MRQGVFKELFLSSHASENLNHWSSSPTDSSVEPFVLDSNGTVVYAEIVPEVTQEPNYEAAMSALKSAS
jgi:peroxiredoxin